jgi:hypothetical protein
MKPTVLNTRQVIFTPSPVSLDFLAQLNTHWRLDSQAPHSSELSSPFSQV